MDLRDLMIVKIELDWALAHSLKNAYRMGALAQ